MDSEHDAGVVSVTYALPPKYTDERLQRVVTLHNNFMKECARFHGADDIVAYMANTSGEDRIKIHYTGTTAVLLTMRHRACKAADSLVVELFYRYYDHFSHLLREDIQDFVQSMLRPHMIPIPEAKIDAKHLGRAIGPSGRNISAVGRGALLIWDPNKPTQGQYMVYLPKDSVNADARQRAKQLCVDAEHPSLLL